jgi:hypothetical protein
LIHSFSQFRGGFKKKMRTLWLDEWQQSAVSSTAAKNI